MTCYRIYLLCPIHTRAGRNNLNKKYLDILIKQNAGYLVEVRESNGSNIIVLDICDNDAGNFLWKLPSPFTVLFVVFRQTQQLLFAHRVFGFHLPCRSRILHDKSVYWSAKSLENHLGTSKIDMKDYLVAIQPNDTT